MQTLELYIHMYISVYDMMLSSFASALEAAAAARLPISQTYFI